MERTTPATLHDVAREAQVSLATASRALNGSSRKVADAYRDRVLAAAAKLNYTPNLSAQAVARGRTNTIALLVGDIADPYFSSIAAGAMAAAGEAGLIVTLAVTGRDAEREIEIVRTLRGQHPRAIVLAGSRFSGSETDAELRAELQNFEAGGGRVVFVSQGAMPFPNVELDNHGGSRELGRRLAELGYRSAAIVAGPEALITSADRVRGFREGFGEGSSDRIAFGAFSRDGGYDATLELVSRGLESVEVVFAASDVMAVGAMSALRSAGIEPGRDVAVAGFDDIPTVRDVTPPLTTVAVPLEELGSRAIALALESDVATSPGALSGSVIVRASTPARR